MPLRIWFQKHTAAGRMPALDRAYAEHARRVLRPESVVDFFTLPPETYQAPFPNRIVRYYYPETLFAQYFVEQAIRAEREGYDAFITGASQDPGLQAARSVVRIPVVGYGEASMLVACMLGDRFGFVGFIPELQAALRASVRLYGLEARCGPMVTLQGGADLLVRAFGGESAPFLEAFHEAARRAVGQGADVLIPGEGLVNELLFQNGITEVEGVPIVDSDGVALKVAELMVDLRRLCGMMASNAGYFHAAPPRDLVDHLRSLYLPQQGPASQPTGGPRGRHGDQEEMRNDRSARDRD